MVYDINRYKRSRRPFLKDGRKYYPLKRDALKSLVRVDDRVLFSSRFNAYYIKRIKRPFFKKK